MLYINLKKLRELKGLTQAEMSKVLNISRGAYSMYEINKREMNYDSLCAAADFFGVTTDYLLGRKQEDIFILTDEERTIIEKYRKTDERGRQGIKCIVEMEYGRLPFKKDTEKEVM